FRRHLLGFTGDDQAKTRKVILSTRSWNQSPSGTAHLSLYKNDKKGRQAYFLFPWLISSISAPLPEFFLHPAGRKRVTFVE
ncbi:hypothetical protein IFM89_031097, partial [Coptis chinensis]